MRHPGNNSAQRRLGQWVGAVNSCRLSNRLAPFRDLLLRLVSDLEKSCAIGCSPWSSDLPPAFLPANWMVLGGRGSQKRMPSDPLGRMIIWEVPLVPAALSRTIGKSSVRAADFWV